MKGLLGKFQCVKSIFTHIFFLSKFDFQIFKTNIEDFNVLIVSFLIYFPKIYGTWIRSEISIKMPPRRTSGNNLPLDASAAYRQSLEFNFNVTEIFGSKMGLFLKVIFFLLILWNLTFSILSGQCCKIWGKQPNGHPWSFSCSQQFNGNVWGSNWLNI